MQDAAFVSGGSGFLGSYIVSELLERGCEAVYVLMRGKDNSTCERRLRNLWWERTTLREAVGSRVHAVAGDITLEGLGLEKGDYADISSKVRYIFHAAAEIGVNQTAEQFGRVNVDGTANMLLFAHTASQTGGLERFVHISTAYVAGTREGLVREDELDAKGFNSLYEQSKFGAEQLVREHASTLPTSIVRPGQIVGDAQTGFVANFNTLYYPLKLYLKGKLPAVSANRAMKVNMVPVDYVARLAVVAAQLPEAEGRTFHALAPEELQPSVKELLDFVRMWAIEHLHFDPGAARFVPIAGAAAAGRARNMAPRNMPKKKSFAQNLLALAPYFDEKRHWDLGNAASLDVDMPHWKDYIGNLLSYAVRKGFLDHTGRSVFEQMLVRMSSKRSPIAYFDVASEGTRKTTGPEVRTSILQAAAALQQLGVKPGERIALSGVNSLRYFMLDAAIGLVGAASVPLYYTLPPADVATLVSRSGANLVFLGTSKLLDASHDLGVQVVSLTDEARKGVMSWQEFLALGAGKDGAACPELPPPAFDGVATIRYTSGTTGDPKGVLFEHAQLRWMGEVMPSLLDWKTRNAKLRYLSFLPMSHVVEGILVSYAPYYMLSDIELYYLDDFSLLAEKLPEVRPTLFFSVPRFYEKVWNQFEASGIGKRYLAMKDGPARRALGKVARAGLLRKAGLDKCRQLIVGSAPVSMELLENFRALGIEIHNAYGVTEAPLISLSRLGDNELGSAGDTLPETQARISPEGEILVSGPQVTAGYDGQGGCLDDEGFFHTGDFGSWSQQGKLVIGGRKKELLVTSYGKNISPEKVETLLKTIPGVSEALLVGEGKPYVGALLWREEDAPPLDGTALDEAVLERNAQLSHPEQIKRWAVMEGSLSIAQGELTPNLKLRRRDVAVRYASAVEALYATDFPANGVPGATHTGAQDL